MPSQTKSLKEMESELTSLLSSPPKVSSVHLSAMSSLLSRRSVKALLNAVIASDEYLAEIARRSYTHTLGFRKIVLLDPGYPMPDGTRGYGFQLRLHIWQPGAGESVPMIESMHEHSFDFVSHMLVGEMENQCYRFVPLDASETRLFERLKAHLAQLSATELTEANRGLEMAEAMRLTGFGSRQAEDERSVSTFDRAELLKRLGLEDHELDLVVALQGRFQAASVGTGAGNYTHRLTEIVRLNPHAVLRLRQGDTYFHGNEYAHRLYMQAGRANATMIVTSPVSGAVGGSFQRPTWVPEADIEYARSMYTPDELRVMLTDFLVLIDDEDCDGRLLTVGNPVDQHA
ncbi:MAG: hypothetical protein K2X93_10595 [Candidatus Obscuribacterales bacterium]|nr:hypothetical protein [Candidatus Obscuribacterales bacterium]